MKKAKTIWQNEQKMLEAHKVIVQGEAFTPKTLHERLDVLPINVSVKVKLYADIVKTICEENNGSR